MEAREETAPESAGEGALEKKTKSESYFEIHFALSSPCE